MIKLHFGAYIINQGNNLHMLLATCLELRPYDLYTIQTMKIISHRKNHVVSSGPQALFHLNMYSMREK